MRHRLELEGQNELDLHVVYGWDPFAGFFGELRADNEDEPIVEYSALTADYDQRAPLRGLVDWLILVGALSGQAVNEALLALASPQSIRVSKQGRKALQVIATLKHEAD